MDEIEAVKIVSVQKRNAQQESGIKENYSSTNKVSKAVQRVKFTKQKSKTAGNSITIAKANTAEKIHNGAAKSNIKDINMEKKAFNGNMDGKEIVRETAEGVIEIVETSSDGTYAASKTSETSNVDEVLNELGENGALETIVKSVKENKSKETDNDGKTSNSDLKKNDQESSNPAPVLSKLISEEFFHKLVGQLHEKDDTIYMKAKDEIEKALQSQTGHVIALLTDIRKKRSRMPRRTVKILLNLVKRMLTKKTDIDDETGKSALLFALKELTFSSQYDPVIQNAASEVIVEIGRGKHIRLVLEALTDYREKNAVTHFMILHCLGKLAIANEVGMIPFIKPLLSTLLSPNVVDLKLVHLKQAQTYAIRCFTDVIMNQSNTVSEEEPTASIEMTTEDSEANSTEKKDMNPKTSSFLPEVSETYDLLYAQWLHSHEPKMSVDILETLSSLGCLLSRLKKEANQTSKLVKLAGSGRKRMAILLKKGLGVDEARILAKKPIAEMKHLYVAKENNFQKSLHDPNSLGPGYKRKRITETAIEEHPTTLQPFKKPAFKSKIDMQRYTWKRNVDAEQPSKPTECGSETNCQSEDAKETNTGAETVPKRLSGAGKKRLSILLRRGMDVEEAKIKALTPLAHLKYRGVKAQYANKRSKIALSKYKFTRSQPKDGNNATEDRLAKGISLQNRVKTKIVVPSSAAPQNKIVTNTQN